MTIPNIFLQKSIPCLFFILSASFSSSQLRTLEIRGNITDTVNHTHVKNATISLLDSSGKLIKIQMTDNKGNFHFEKLPLLPSGLLVEASGYNKVVINEVKDLSSGKLLELFLSPKIVRLENVTISGTKNLIENKIDKLVYNTSKDLTSQGGTLVDILKKIPGITADIDGNIELMGNSSLNFLIDGRPSAIFGNNIADALQSIPASQIQSIEVISNPGAKFDAAGTGGIINIILKKTKIEGFNGNLSLAAGTRLENGNFNAGWKKGNLSISSYFGGNAQLNSVTPFNMDRSAYNANGGIVNRLVQRSMGLSNRNSYKTGTEIDLNFSKSAMLTLSVGYNHMINQSNGNFDQSLSTYDSLGSINTNIISSRHSRSKATTNAFENSLFFTKALNNKGAELSIGYNGSFGHNYSFYSQIQQNKINTANLGGSESLNPGIENEVEFSIDIKEPVQEKISLENGIKFSKTAIKSNADVLTLDPIASSFFHDSSQSYQSNYHRWVYAGYFSLSISISKKWTIKAGLRFEHTKNESFYSNSGKTDLPSYDNLAPSFVALHSLSQSSSLKFGFSYRLERPDFRDLNPFMNLSDPHNITTGNPLLQAEIGHNFEITYLKNFENGSSLSIVANNQKNSPDIKPYITYYTLFRIGDSIYQDVTLTTRDNIASEIRRGINISISIPSGKKWSTRSNLLLFNRHLKNLKAVPVITDAMGLRINVTTTCQFNKKLVAEAFGSYSMGMRWQGRQPSIFTYTFAIRKQVLGNKANIGLVTTIPFNKYINQRSIQEAKGFISHNYRQVPYRSLGVYFSWKFGKLKLKQTRESENYLYSPPSDN